MKKTAEISVFEITISAFLLQDILTENVYETLHAFISEGLGKDGLPSALTGKESISMYCWNLFYPIESGGVYNKGKHYNFRVRTVNKDMANKFYELLGNYENEFIKPITAEVRILPQKIIEKIYSITPCILQEYSTRYWKSEMSDIDYSRRLKKDLTSRYNNLTGLSVEEDYKFYSDSEFVNQKPLLVRYGRTIYLGDKVELLIPQEETAQNIAYMSLGTGILDMNDKGAGYVNFKYL